MLATQPTRAQTFARIRFEHRRAPDRARQHATFKAAERIAAIRARPGFRHGSGRLPIHRGKEEGTGARVYSASIPYVCAVPPSAYVAPRDRKPDERPSIAGPIGIAAALKAEAPHVGTLRQRAHEAAKRLDFGSVRRMATAIVARDDKRAARKVRMTRVKRRGWA